MPKWGTLVSRIPGAHHPVRPSRHLTTITISLSSSVNGAIVNYATYPIFTGRNEVVAKVIFLHVSVILFTEGGSASVHAGIPPPPRTRQTPPRADTPPDQADPPGPGRTPDQAEPPRTRQTHPPDQADTPPPPWTRQTPLTRQNPPRTRQTPPQTRQTPPRADTPPPPPEQTSAYGQRVAGTHPTGMHSCFSLSSFYVYRAYALFTCNIIISVCAKSQGWGLWQQVMVCI